jgi:tRNA A-37 threonylcarbamoyl transferase component Bud32/Tfp pilus assembly protein PilF
VSSADHHAPETPDRPDGILTPGNPSATSSGQGAGNNPAAVSPSSGRYTLGEEIARGGMGIVYRATDTILGREVAVKVLQEKLGPASAVIRRFYDEARITGQLQHPGIPPVHDLGTLPDSRPFLVMKLIKGDTLDTLLGRRADPAADRGRLLAVFEQVCQAVGYAHAHDVIHRDLKPMNVMVGAFGEVQVMDWGLAKVLGASPATMVDTEQTTPATAIQSLRQSDGEFTQAGSVLGTPAFMPPEQALGAIGKIDTRSDVFGLGGILAVVLTGRPPFAANSADTIRLQAAQGDLGDCFARLDASGTQPELVALCKRCLAPKQNDRPTNGGEVAKAVADLRAAADERARQAELDRVKAAEQRKRRKVQLLLAMAIVLLAVAGAGFAAWRERQRHEARNQMELIEQRASAAAEAGDITRAAALFGEMETLAGADPGLAANGPSAAERREELERLAAFRMAAAVALRDGVHNVRSREPTDSVLARCEEALGLYGFTEPAFDQARMPVGQLSSQYRDEILTTGRELLVLAAIRLALFDTKDDAGKAATRRALGLLDRAASLPVRLPNGELQFGATAGELMLRMLWHRRLGENGAADAAGDQMSARVKADGGLKMARDHYLFGSVRLHLLKKPKEALAAYRQALKREPNHYGALFGTYLCYAELKDTPGKVAALTGCLALRPAEADLHYFRGMAFFEQQQFDEAYQDFDAAVIQNPNYAIGYFYRGRMLVVKDQWADAEADFTRAVDLDPGFVQALAWRAVAQAKLGRPAEAVADADRAAAAEPTNRTTLFFAARAYAQAVAAVKDATVAERYGAACVAYLRRALDAGFTDTGRLRPGGDFDPVRSRPDFQALSTGPSKK